MSQDRERRSSTLGGGLGRRLLGWFLVISLIPLFLSNAWGYFRSQRIIEGLVDRYLQGIAQLHASHVGEHLGSLRVRLEDLASRADLTSPALEARALGTLAEDRFAPHPLLVAGLERYPGFESLFIFDDEGRLLHSAPLGPSDLALWMGPPPDASAGPVDVVREPAPPHFPRIRLIVPMTDGADPIPGLFLGGAIDVSVAGAFPQIPEHTAGSVETFLLDRAGRPIFVSHPHGELDFSLPLNTPLLTEPEGSSAVYRDRLGVEVLGTVGEIPGRGWRLLAEVPLSAALEELRELRRVSVVLAVVLAGLVLLAALATAGRIVAPVRRLVGATRRIGVGDLDARVDIDDPTEIGELGAAFNEMAEDLQETSREVKELHDREMRRAAQLATVGELAAGVAHEIKNPVAGIAGGLELAARRIPPDPELDEILEEMGRLTGRIEVAVRDLLAFARPSEPAFAPTDVNAVVGRALALVRAAADKSRVELSTELEAELPKARADEELIRQALVNLVINGVQATPAGGAVVVSTRLEGGSIAIRVKDEGPGIAEEDLERVFKPFYTTKHKGTGLGLSITRRIVERHDGRLSITSRVGDGTEVTLLLPLGDGEPPSPAPAGPDTEETAP